VADHILDILNARVVPVDRIAQIVSREQRLILDIANERFLGRNVKYDVIKAKHKYDASEYDIEKTRFHLHENTPVV
jgi:hypothetical protein